METCLGREIRKALFDKEIMQLEYAKHLGISANYLSLICHGRRTPSWRLLRQMVYDLDIDIVRVLKEDRKFCSEYTNPWKEDACHEKI